MFQTTPQHIIKTFANDSCFKIKHRELFADYYCFEINHKYYVFTDYLCCKINHEDYLLFINNLKKETQDYLLICSKTINRFVQRLLVDLSKDYLRICSKTKRSHRLKKMEFYETFSQTGGRGQPDFISLIQKSICTRNTVDFLKKF